MKPTISVKRPSLLAAAVLMLLLSFALIMSTPVAAYGQCNGTAPSINSITPSNSIADTTVDMLITGLNFTQTNGSANVTSAFAVEVANPANVVQASTLTVLNGNLINALFSFGSSNACKTFRIFVNGPCGTSASTSFAEFKTACPSAQQRITTLRNSVTALISSEVLTSKQAKPLIKNLNKAESKLENGNENAAIGQLQDFIDRVTEMGSEGLITSVQSQPLVDLATSIILQITEGH